MTSPEEVNGIRGLALARPVGDCGTFPLQDVNRRHFLSPYNRRNVDIRVVIITSPQAGNCKLAVAMFFLPTRISIWRPTRARLILRETASYPWRCSFFESGYLSGDPREHDRPRQPRIYWRGQERVGRRIAAKRSVRGLVTKLITAERFDSPSKLRPLLEHAGTSLSSEVELKQSKL